MKTSSSSKSSNTQSTQKIRTELTPVQVKFRKLKMREQEAARIGETIDQLMAQANRQTSGGCFAWLSKWIRFGSSKDHRNASQAAEISSVTSQAEHASSSCASGSSSASEVASASKSLEVNSRIFGLAGAKRASDPAKMLEQAASVMRARIEQLEQRASQQRSEAARLVKLGQKQPAMRALKKAKQLEASVASNSASLDAVEQQVDLLAQAAVQKTLTSALETTSKTMQKDKKLVARAEKAVDDVSEVRDMAEDLNNAMSELANHGSNDIDEDDLMEELEAMANSGKASEASVDDEDEFAAEPSQTSETKRLNGSGSKTFGSASNALQALKLPSVPKKQAKEEKNSLLAQDSASGAGAGMSSGM